MNASDYNNILHTRKLPTMGGSRQSVSNLVLASNSDWEQIFRPECTKLDDHSLGEHCQFAVVTKVSRPLVDSTKSVLCEPACSLFELTSSFGEHDVGQSSGAVSQALPWSLFQHCSVLKAASN
ncbi:hypothetical protein DUI87_16861 [Hirundo rustica rustica]|uniref:Uncharacterized protein n=1 Tax=Hirundo rustica rustica TaxID=333673 RepID=A0A3M0K2J6_HIRRU|nr:hypothetical protein DUI87_16861 [Hirundo rustica rustica]